MLRLEYDKKQIEEIIDRIVKKTMNMDMTWEWPCGVAYYGIGEAYEKTGKEEYLTLLKDRVDELIDLGLPNAWTVNACAMGHCLVTLWQATKEQKYLDILMSKIEYLKRMPSASGTMCCSTRSLRAMTFRSRPGRTPCSWRRFSCCGWAS